MKTLLLLFIPVLAFGCKDLGTDQPSTEGWAIYRLRDSSITAHDASRQPLGTLVLADEPFMTVTDISAYYWSSHTFVPSPRIENQLTALRDSHGSVYASLLSSKSVMTESTWEHFGMRIHP